MTEQPDEPDQSDEAVRPDPDEAGDGTAEPTPEAPGAGSPAPTGARWLLVTALVLVVAAGLSVTGWLAWQIIDRFEADPSRAGAGDCLAGAGDRNDLRRVACDADEAAWRVAGLQPEVAWADFQQIPEDELCGEHPDTELAVWFGNDRDTGTGDVFCLEPLG